MTSINIPISEEQLEKVRRQAAEVGVTPEAFLAQMLDRALSDEEPSLDEVAAYILKKNAELYRRLS